MTTMFSAIKSASRAAVIAAVLGASALTAAPAFAQGGPSMSFGLQIPGQGGYGHDRNHGRHNGWDNHDRYETRCLTNREVARGLAQYGYRRVDIVRELSRERVDLTAQYGNWQYRMRVDKCTGEVSRVQRLARIGGYGSDGHTGRGYGGDRYDGYDSNGISSGFGFQFNFGN